MVFLAGVKAEATIFRLSHASMSEGPTLDRALCAYLQQRFEGADNLYLVNRDVLEVDLEQLVHREGYRGAILVGNLPYQITGAAVEQILSARAAWKRAVVMVQREVGKRMVASPGGKEYGILSVAVQVWTHPERVFDLGPGHFQPPPRVHSSVVRLNFPSTPPVPLRNEPFFFGLVRAAFQQRRKMLKNTLSRHVCVPEPILLSTLSGVGVDPRSRPETVSAAQFEKICSALLAHLEGR